VLKFYHHTANYTRKGRQIMAGFRDRLWLIIAIFLSASFICGLVFLLIRLGQAAPFEISLENTYRAPEQGEIYIGGAITRPGIYPVKTDDTIDSLLSSAGLADNADPNHIKIIVPTITETRQPQKVDLNRADVWLLQSLPGIGEGKAKLIADYRNKYGQFHSIDDLLKINGFGSSMLTKLKDYVTVGD
jgi:competence protein ComEA